jgi:voltage-gated potassium channel
MNKKTFYRLDEFGVRNYKTRYLALISIGSLYLVIALFAVLLLHFESSTDGANITNYADAFWTLQMSASTIGFGDHFPVSFGGRLIVTFMFYIGIGLVGFIGAIIADRIFGFADTSIKNRELRRQNAEILAYNQVLEQKLDTVIQHIESTAK